ncbi:MAG TPA: glycosyltransferase family 1 protein [Acidimicrobiales bacterium]|nr:glycosyltransferase family 1 protein [Acidimicrobiales bacterium]
MSARRLRAAIDVTAIPERPAGAGIYVLRMVEALAAGDAIDLELITTTRDVSRWIGLAPAAQIHAVAPTRRPVRLAWEQVLAPRVVRRVGADVWHGPHYTMPLRASGPRVVTVHDLTFFDHPEWHERSKVVYFRRMIRAAAHRADALICVSQRTADRLGEVLAPTAPVLVVPHGVDHTRFRHDTTAGTVEADAVRLASLGVQAPFIAFLGTLEPRKDVPGLVSAFARIAEARPDLSLVIAGQPGWGAAAVDESVADHGLESRVLRLGYVDADVPAVLFREAAAVAYPSFEEGFGLPALEALACGAPLVTTVGSPMADVVGDAALLVPPDDHDALADALATLVDDTDGVATALRAAGPPVAAPYTWEACAEGHVAAYRLAAG